MSAFSLDGTYLGRWGSYGTGPYEFRNPWALPQMPRAGSTSPTPATTVSWSTTRPSSAEASSWPPPTVQVATPSEGAVEDRPMVMLWGRLQDETAVIGLDVAACRIRRTGSSSTPTRSAWTADRKVLTVPQRGTTANPQWGAVFYGVSRGGTYAFEVTAFDEARQSQRYRPARGLGGCAGRDRHRGPHDRDHCACGRRHNQGTSVVFAGAAAESGSASGRVDLAVQRASDGLWVAALRQLELRPDLVAPADLASPGAAETDWRSPWVAPGGGDYTVTARAVDAAGEFASTSHAFSVEELAPDTVAPTVAVGQPTNGGQVQLDPLVIQGTADDDRDVAAVDVAIRNGPTASGGTAPGGWRRSAPYPCMLDRARSADHQIDLRLDAATDRFLRDLGTGRGCGGEHDHREAFGAPHCDRQCGRCRAAEVAESMRRRLVGASRARPSTSSEPPRTTPVSPASMSPSATLRPGSGCCRTASGRLQMAACCPRRDPGCRWTTRIAPTCRRGIYGALVRAVDGAGNASERVWWASPSSSCPAHQWPATASTACGRPLHRAR